MAKKVFNMQGGLHSAAAYSAFENRAWGSCVADIASLAATAGAGMSVSVAPGDGLISVDAFNARRIQVTSTETVPVPAADATYNRIDTLVAYIDNTVDPVTTVVDNVNNILKFAVVAGTAAATPSAPSAATIQAEIGAGSPYMALYEVLVPQGATNMAGATFTDVRKVMNVVKATDIADNAIIAAKIAANAVTTAKINNNAVTGAKIDKTTFGVASWTTTEDLTGFSYEGKPIYRRTVSVGTLPNNGVKDVLHGIVGVDRLMKIEGVARDSAGTQLPVTYGHPQSPFVMYLVSNGSGGGPSIRITTSSDRTAFSGLVTMEYTKV